MAELTELVFILDCSGSMAARAQDMLDRYNRALEQQRQRYGRCRVTTVLFDHELRLLHDREWLSQVAPLQQLPTGSGSSVWDALAMSCSRLAALQQFTPEGQWADQVRLLVATDGLDNNSRLFDRRSLRQLLEQQRPGWTLEFWYADLGELLSMEAYVPRPERLDLHAGF